MLAALQGQGVDAHAFDPAEQPLDALKGYDRAFIALHGRHGEDGTIQGALELMGIPYTGSGVMASALAMDKFRTKLLWQAAGLPMPEYALLDRRLAISPTSRRNWACRSSSSRRTRARRSASARSRSANTLHLAYAEAAKYDPLVIAEKGVMGGEYTVGIIGRGDDMVALPIIKIEPATECYDYEAKYNRDDTRYLCPCGLPEAKEMEIRRGALEAFRILGGRGWGRVDFLMDEDGNHYFLEVNTAPGMTDHSLVPMAARVAGMDYPALVRRVLELAAND